MAMTNYIEIEDSSQETVQHYLINLDLITCIDASMIEANYSDGYVTKFNAPLRIIAYNFTLKLDCIEDSQEKALEKRDRLYNKLYNYIFLKQSNKEKKIIL